MTERMRPMGEAPPNADWVHVWPKIRLLVPDFVYWHAYEVGGCWVDTDGGDLDAAKVSCYVGWTPIARPLEPDEPKPEARTIPPTPQRLRIQILSAAHESVALGQSGGDFLAMASIAHNEATKRAERAKSDEQKGEPSC